jgi:acetylornithine aminotransferase/acetylornithine/N-succinyldiaminopimelate aminotransferase
MHGTTFGGNPLACAVAIAVIDEIKHSMLLDHNTATGDYFMSRLRELQSKHSSIVEVRGVGLMIGVELNSDILAKKILAGMMDRRILLNRTHDTVLRFLPPYLITRNHVDQTINALDELLTAHTPANPLESRTLAGETVNG